MLASGNLVVDAAEEEPLSVHKNCIEADVGRSAAAGLATAGLADWERGLGGVFRTASQLGAGGLPRVVSVVDREELVAELLNLGVAEL